MQQFLLLEENAEVRELLAFSLSTRFKVTVKEVANSADAVAALNTAKANKQAMDILEKSGGNEKALQALREQGGNFAVFIAPHGKDATLSEYLSNNPLDILIVFVYEGEKPPEKKAPQGATTGFASQKNALAEITKIIVDLWENKKDADLETDESAFCPIRTTLLIKATPLKSDIYIRLSAAKFLKIFHKGSDFDGSDVQKYYDQKKVEYLYIKKQETNEFLQRFQQELDALLNNPNLTQEQAAQHVEATQDTLHELVNKVGFTEQIQDVAKKNVELTLKMVGQNPRLATVLARVQKDGNYISQHSTILAHVACCIAQEMEWTSDNTFSKLTLAALMHDISVMDPEVAKIGTLKQLQEKRKDPSLNIPKDYHLHPMKSADIVKAFQEIPADVDSIVMQHHEHPSGSGFPRGLSHNYISPLSALFIIAHDMTTKILAEGKNFSIPQFVETKRAEYHQGNFKKIMHKLEAIKL